MIYRKTYALRMNDMRFPKIEMLCIVALSDSKEKLENLLVEFKCDQYNEDQWVKVYKKGSILEWYNAPHPMIAEPIFELEPPFI